MELQQRDKLRKTKQACTPKTYKQETQSHHLATHQDETNTHLD
ncbi:uncharacterized protein G2W53_030995 [Senna tora]|uniref:Uncharacterized protein n=1 Tax=Senna tora TaxID=362788 RepID=A0A834WF38_9FABA|nr:uncharacterized protein G2W53_030995 [Senna tora]